MPHKSPVIISMPPINSGILNDLEMLLEAFKEKRSVRLVKFHEVANDYDLCNIYAGRLSLSELLEFEECLLRATFAYTRPRKESKMGEVKERNMTERIFGIYSTYVLYYTQPSDYVSKIHATSKDLLELKQFVTDILLPGRHLDTIACIYKLLLDDAFNTDAFVKCYDPACHRGYALQYPPDDVVDDDERHSPLDAVNYVMEHPILKTMTHVQKEMELKQRLISNRPLVAEVGDHFLNRLEKIYASLKREVEKVDVGEPDEPKPDAGTSGKEKSQTDNEPAEGPSRTSIKDKAYGSAISYARNRRYADPKMHENFPDTGGSGAENNEEIQQISNEQSLTDNVQPKKIRKRRPKIQAVEIPGGSTLPADVSPEAVSSSQSHHHTKLKAPRRVKGKEEIGGETNQPSPSNPPAVGRSTKKKARVATSPRKPPRPGVDADFEAEMKRIEALLDDSQSERAKKLLG